MASSEAAENRYENTSTTNGTDRPTVKRAPPSGEPASWTTAIRPVWVEIASGSCSTDTTERIAPGYAAVKNATPTPSTNAITATGQKSVESSQIVATSTLTAATRTASAAIMMRRRFHRSAATPAGSVKRATGRMRANATNPALAGEPVMPRTSSGYAIDVIRDPRFESSCPAWSSTKSRLRRRGTAFTDDATGGGGGTPFPHA